MGIFAFWCILAGVFALDRLSKIWAAAALTMGQVRVVLQNVLELRLTQNNGMALGLFSGNVMANLALPLIAVGIWMMIFHKYEATRYKRIASALMLGGFVGNFVDRLLYGYVVDMLYFPFLPWFICNVADIAICAGVGMLGISLICRPGDWREKHAKQSSGSNP